MLMRQVTRGGLGLTGRNVDVGVGVAGRLVIDGRKGSCPRPEVPFDLCGRGWGGGSVEVDVGSAASGSRKSMGIGRVVVVVGVGDSSASRSWVGFGCSHSQIGPM